MRKDKLRINDIRTQFKEQDFITYHELLKFYRREEPDLKIGTFKWRVYKLKEKKVMNSFKTGIYRLEKRKEFMPNINLTLKRVYNHVNKHFPYIDICIWETSWLHNLINHQPFNSLTILEVDKDIIEAVFQSLKEKRSDVFLDPKGKDVDNYISNENAVIVRPIIKESPVRTSEKIRISKIEKILVDIFSDKELFRAYQGQELINIFERIYEEYSVNITTLYRYAKNRGIREKIINFIILNTQIDKKYI
ncbi:hypothetical protein RBH29_06390 [Herbivorax sp. ANBcel31]|uniref:DUF6577 family protein n=1 Tax=Herbivorax sp. ANBcel31 TaxID=3069754 RepID=UPI0027AEE03C|nr:DUF6577 family protein [Herbivorax sp. ANBcel31]MDQ2086066.1 hypothetical protein [Herbivorax sp. ANBcel31]